MFIFVAYKILKAIKALKGMKQGNMLEPHYFEGKIEAGCDEAGRVCLAGSVYAAAGILPPGYNNELLNDSKKLTENMALSQDEATYILHMLNNNKLDFYAHSIRQKLIRQFNLADVRTPEVLSAINRHTEVLKDAMNRKCMCMLRNYSSPHSKTVSDRIVEPFLFMNNGLDIRCHEIKSHTNKTFKLARIGEVELLDVEWIAEKEHKQVFTDLFMFSGEERHAVTLLLDQLARNLIVEEYPASATCISPVDDDPRHWLFTTDVASYLGIGRFVMGLFNHIKVMGDDNFMLYIRNEVESMKM